MPLVDCAGDVRRRDWSSYTHAGYEHIGPERRFDGIYCNACYMAMIEHYMAQAVRHQERMLRNRDKQREAYQAVQLDPRLCKQCGESFHPARSDARYCSGACRVAAHRATKRH